MKKLNLPESVLREKALIEKISINPEKDPAVREFKRERLNEQLKYIDRMIIASKPIRDELLENGISVETMTDLYRFQPLSENISNILLKWLKSDLDLGVQHDMISLLRNLKKKFDGKPLSDLFDKTKFKQLRPDIASTISETAPKGITNWVLKTLANPEEGSERFCLALAAAKLAPGEETNKLLLSLYAESPVAVIPALGQSGREKELAFLENQLLLEANKDLKTLIQRALNRIKNRVKRDQSKSSHQAP